MNIKLLLVLALIALVVILGCGESTEESETGEEVAAEGDDETAEEAAGEEAELELDSCLISPKLVQQYCTIRKPIKQESGSSILCGVDTWWDHSQWSGARQNLVFFPGSTSIDLDTKKANDRMINDLPIWDEAGIGDGAYVMPINYYDSHRPEELSPEDFKTATRERLEDLGFYLVVQKGRKIYTFKSYDGKDRGDNNFCSLEQMKALANAVIKGTLPKYEKPFCYKEENNELPDLVKQFCTVKTNLDRSVYCQVVDENYDQPLSISPWEYTPNIRKLSTAGGLPSWDEPGIGDEAWVTPLIEMGEAAHNKIMLTKEEVAQQGFNLYVKTGDKVYQFFVDNQNYDDRIYNEEEYIYSNCNLEQTKAMAKALFGGS